jgi:uncharacterized damage-inducible protein DinB
MALFAGTRMKAHRLQSIGVSEVYSMRVLEDAEIPRAIDPNLQYVVDIYASEINKLASVWRSFDDGVLDYRPHAKSASVGQILAHELLSARRFFGEFLGLPEPGAASVVPDPLAVQPCVERLATFGLARLTVLAQAPHEWWSAPVRFFDVDRTRMWVFWRRVLHSAHHRTQLTVYLRLLDRPVPSIYGPTADFSWTGADPTQTVDAAARR